MQLVARALAKLALRSADLSSLCSLTYVFLDYSSVHTRLYADGAYHSLKQNHSKIGCFIILCNHSNVSCNNSRESCFGNANRVVKILEL